jgi:glucose-6-phosphate 1-dehydrogenase
MMTDSTSIPARPASPDGRGVDPCALVIFGASGDLTQRKLVPALYNLLLNELLPERFAVVGVSRKEIDRDAFLTELRRGIESFSRSAFDPGRWPELSDGISCVAADPGRADGFAALAEHLQRVAAERDTGANRLFYLATPPSAFTPIVERLGESGLSRPAGDGAWARLVIEKPIGRDLESACRLNRAVNRVFDERDVFRIDHYLGKETVQNLLVFRFANSIFEPLWNQKYVDNVQIAVAESIGVAGRGAYYEEAGTTRDVMQNHMFQLLCLIAMEPPVSLEPDAIRDEKVKVLQALRPIDPKDVARSTVRGQYVRGVIDGVQVEGYKSEPGVAADSRTETYVAARLHIDNWRWAGVPFYLRAGKRLASRCTEIALQFHDVPHRLFEADPLAPNTLTLRLQPNEGISLKFDVKVPGTSTRIQDRRMDFLYDTSFSKDSPEAYERLLIDAILGDSTLFIRRDEVEWCWRFIDRLQQGWSLEDPDNPLPDYSAGNWGPAEADVMLARDGRVWRRL